MNNIGNSPRPAHPPNLTGASLSHPGQRSTYSSFSLASSVFFSLPCNSSITMLLNFKKIHKISASFTFPATTYFSSPLSISKMSQRSSQSWCLRFCSSHSSLYLSNQAACLSTASVFSNDLPWCWVQSSIIYSHQLPVSSFECCEHSVLVALFHWAVINIFLRITDWSLAVSSLVPSHLDNPLRFKVKCLDSFPFLPLFW